MRHIVLCLLVSVLVPGDSVAGSTAGTIAETIEIVESVPDEIDLGSDSLRDAPAVWIEMIAGATSTIDICSFYFSDDPARDDDALDLVLDAVVAAAGRGVEVRLLSDRGFDKTYPEISLRLDAVDGVEARLLDARGLWGGVQHSKYFIVDGDEFFVGSQNWDWRALEHIREVGVHINDAKLAGGLGSIFAMDWRLAGAEESVPPTSVAAVSRLTTSSGDSVQVTLAASPPQALPAGIPWDLPMLVDLIDSARTTICFQLLSYNPGDRDGNYFADLENALRRAAARGVDVRIILSNWAKRSYMLPWIKSLAALATIEIRFTNIPPHSTGFVPFARVEHAKYLVADNARVWLGTSNWAANYFHESRNISLFITGAAVAADLGDFFDRSWKSDFAETVSPCGDYQPPRQK